MKRWIKLALMGIEREVEREQSRRQAHAVTAGARAAVLMRSGGQCEVENPTHELVTLEDGRTYMRPEVIGTLTVGRCSTIVLLDKNGASYSLVTDAKIVDAVALQQRGGGL